MHARKSRSNFVNLVVIALALVLLTGCQSGTPQTTNQGPITLQWWGVFWDVEVVKPLIDEYQQQNQNVKIEYANKWPGGNREIAAKLYQDELDRVLRDRNAVAIPDIFMTENTWTGNYEAYTSAAPTSVIDAATVSTAFYPVVSKDFVRNNSVKGLPLWMDSLAVLYNKDLLQTQAVTVPPTDWVDFRNLADDLTTRTGSDITQAGFSAGTSQNVSFATELLQLIMFQNGVRVTDNQDNPVFSTDANIAGAVDFYKDFAASSSSWDSKQNADAIMFLEGKLAMMVAPSWRYQDILYFNDLYKLGLDIGVAPMPQLDNQTQPTQNWATYWGNMVALDRPNSEEAWKFLTWLTQPEQLRKLRTQDATQRKFVGMLYPRADMQRELQTDQFLRVYNDSLPTATSWYMVDGLAVKEILKELIDSGGQSSNIATAENKVQQVVNNKGKL